MWLKDFDPHYLLTYPSIMPWLMDYMAETGDRPQSLREIRFISEPLDKALEARLAEEWQVKRFPISTRRTRSVTSPSAVLNTARCMCSPNRCWWRSSMIRDNPACPGSPGAWS